MQHLYCTLVGGPQRRVVMVTLVSTGGQDDRSDVFRVRCIVIVAVTCRTTGSIFRRCWASTAPRRELLRERGWTRRSSHVRMRSWRGTWVAEANASTAALQVCFTSGFPRSSESKDPRHASSRLTSPHQLSPASPITSLLNQRQAASQPPAAYKASCTTPPHIP